jgi:uncharacterized protein (DUF2147 family)
MELLMNTRHVRRLYVDIILLVFFTGISAEPVNDSIIGKWLLDDKTAIFDFYRIGNEYYARLVPLAEPDMADTNNPVDSLKRRKLDGVTLVYGLSYEAKKNRWEGGRVYNPENGKTYFCHCKLTSEGTQLIFTGYLGVDILGQNRIWTRVACNTRRD